MWALLKWLWAGLVHLVGLIFPVFAKARAYSGMGPILRWTLHVVMVAAILIGLHFLNQLSGLTGLLGKGPPLLRKNWLPILFLLLYALGWLGWYLYKLLGPDEDDSDFPDIDEAWEEALRALAQAGLGLADAPLFLVVGRPAGTEQALMRAAQLQLAVKAPAREAPVHIYASRDAIYVTCGGASLLGRQAELLEKEADGIPLLSQTTDGGTTLSETMSGEDQYKTIVATGQVREIQDILQRAKEQGRQQPNDDEKREIRRLMAQEAASVRKAQKARQSIFREPAEVARYTARMAHVCRLLVRDRRPYVPVNGLLFLLPMGGTESDEDAGQLAQVCQRDLATARRVLQVHCPTFALICDLETVPGFNQFKEGFPDKQRQKRVGQRFPLVPDLDGAGTADMIERGVQWLGQVTLPGWTYKFFRTEKVASKEECGASVRSNTGLYQFLAEMRERLGRVGRVLTRGLLENQEPPLLFGGCYLAGTGRDVADQAFVPGVFRRLVEGQDFVSWTQVGVEEEASYQSWTRTGYMVLGTLVFLAVLGLGFVIISTFKISVK